MFNVDSVNKILAGHQQPTYQSTRDTAPVNAETVESLLAERDRLRAELAAMTERCDGIIEACCPLLLPVSDKCSEDGGDCDACVERLPQAVQVWVDERKLLKESVNAMTERAEQAEGGLTVSYMLGYEKGKEKAERENRVLARMVEDMARDLANYEFLCPMEKQVAYYRKDAEAELKGAHDA